MADTSIARTILEQLGGGRFVMMTGAKNLAAHEDGALSFRLPSRFATNGINWIKITLTPADDYTIETGRIVKFRVTRFEPVTGIYAENLRETFTRITGLDCTMGQIERAS